MSEGDQGACRLVITDLAGVFLIGLVSAMMGHSFLAHFLFSFVCNLLIGNEPKLSSAFEAVLELAAWGFYGAADLPNAKRPAIIAPV